MIYTGNIPCFCPVQFYYQTFITYFVTPVENVLWIDGVVFVIFKSRKCNVIFNVFKITVMLINDAQISAVSPVVVLFVIPGL